MARYARIHNDTVAEIIVLPDGLSVKDAFHPNIAATLRPAGDNIREGYVVQGDTLIPPTAPAIDLVGKAAAVRYRKETAGIAIDGSVIATDRESQAMINGAYNFVQVNPTATVQYKSATGFVALDKAAVETIACAVGAHVQACFAREAGVVAAIEAGAITTSEEVEAAFADF